MRQDTGIGIHQLHKLCKKWRCGEWSTAWLWKWYGLHCSNAPALIRSCGPLSQLVARFCNTTWFYFCSVFLSSSSLLCKHVHDSAHWTLPILANAFKCNSVLFFHFALLKSSCYKASSQTGDISHHLGDLAAQLRVICIITLYTDCTDVGRLAYSIFPANPISEAESLCRWNWWNVL